MPIDYKNYPKNWKSEIRPRILARANNCCEFCGVENYAIGYRKNNNFIAIEKSMQGDIDADEAIDNGFKIIKIVLTIAHLDHDTKNNSDENLKALCQRCHLLYDLEHHKKNSKNTRAKKRKQLSLF